MEGAYRVTTEGGRAYVVLERGGERLTIVVGRGSAEVKELATQDVAIAFEAYRTGNIARVKEVHRRCREASVSRREEEGLLRRAARGEDVEGELRSLEENRPDPSAPKAYLARRGRESLVVLATSSAAYMIPVAAQLPLPSLPRWAYDVKKVVYLASPIEDEEVLREAVERADRFYSCLTALDEVNERGERGALPLTSYWHLQRALLQRGVDAFNGLLSKLYRAAETAERAGREVIALQDAVILPPAREGGRPVLLTQRGEARLLSPWRYDELMALQDVVERGRAEPLPEAIAEGGEADVEEVRRALRARREEVKEKAPWAFFVL